MNDILKSLQIITAAEQAGKQLNESQVNEVSSKTKASYANKAEKDAGGKRAMAALSREAGDEKGAKDYDSKAEKREKGIEKVKSPVKKHFGMKESAKPDYLDMDKDGDKKEPMKKALKDKEEQGVEEERSPYTNPDYDPLKGREYKSKMAKKYPDLYKKDKGDHKDAAEYFKKTKDNTKLPEEQENKVYRHKGTYGTSYDGDDKKKAEPVKRGRGRPKKDAGSDGEVKKYDWSAFGGKVSIPAHKGTVTKHKMVGEAATLQRVMSLLSEAVALEKKMTDADKEQREKIVKGMKKDTAGLKKRYGKRWKDVMYATATKQAMKEAIAGAALGGLAGAALTKTPGGAMAGAKVGSALQDKLTGDVEEGIKDLAKKAGGAVKKVASKALDTLGHGSDEELIKDLQKKTGMPQTGKKPMAGPVKESKVMECGMDNATGDDVKIVGSPDALVTMLKLAGMDSAANAMAAAPAAPMMGMDDMESELDDMGGDMLDDEMAEEYANTPDATISGMDAAIPSGDDLHKSKRAYPKAAGGDNPMALEEIWESYQVLKRELL